MLHYLDLDFVVSSLRAHIKHPFLFSVALLTHPFGLMSVDQLLQHTEKQNWNNKWELRLLLKLQSNNCYSFVNWHLKKVDPYNEDIFTSVTAHCHHCTNDTNTLSIRPPPKNALFSITRLTQYFQKLNKQTNNKKKMILISLPSPFLGIYKFNDTLYTFSSEYDK